MMEDFNVTSSTCSSPLHPQSAARKGAAAPPAPIIASTENLVTCMLSQEQLDATVVPVIKQLAKAVSLIYCSVDGRRHVYCIKGAAGGGGGNAERSAASQAMAYITLTVLKGSLMTFVWSPFARIDDAYKVTMTNDLDTAMVHNLLSPSSSTGSSSQTLSQQSVYLLWNMQGIDMSQSKLQQGTVEWNNMHCLQALVGIDSVGVLTFAKMLGKLLICLPLFKQRGVYLVPMPATVMFNYLVIFTTCPLHLATVGSAHAHALQKLLIHLGQEDGSGFVLTGYQPYWLADGYKVLHHAHCVQADPNLRQAVKLFPNNAAGAAAETKVRLVEIFEAFDQLFALVEVLSPGYWTKQVRYVVSNVSLLVRAAKAMRSKLEAFAAPDIPVLDNIEWAREVEHRREQAGGSVMHVHNVDFRNTYQWGASLEAAARMSTAGPSKAGRTRVAKGGHHVIT